MAKLLTTLKAWNTLLLLFFIKCTFYPNSEKSMRLC